MSASEPEPPDEVATETDAEKELNLVGSQVGKYRVLRVLGRGGMGAVYEAVHEAIGQRIAIKVLKAELSSDTRHVQRFFDEARAVNIVQHPGLIKVYDFGHLPDGTAYITMEFLEGETLQERISRFHDQKQRMDLLDVLRIARQVGSGLEAVHAKGIAHRDLKPANLFLVPDKESPSGERAKLLDFGIAKFYDSTKTGDAVGSGKGHHLTTVGKLLGTPAYMSPEQCSGADHVDDSIDVYALGVILYQMLAGRLPFEAPHAVLIMTKHIVEPPPPLSAAELALPQLLCDLVHQMLAKDRKERPSMAQVVVRLEQLLETETGASSLQWRSQHRRRWPGRKRWQRYLLSACVVVASVLIILFGRQRRAERRSRATNAVQVAPLAVVVPAPPGPPAGPALPKTPAPAPPSLATPGPAEPAAGNPGEPSPPPAPVRKRIRAAKAPKRSGGRPLGVPTAPTAPAAPAPTPTVVVPILR
jgi:serine/threonine protein kinase